MTGAKPVQVQVGQFTGDMAGAIVGHELFRPRVIQAPGDKNVDIASALDQS